MNLQQLQNIEIKKVPQATKFIVIEFQIDSGVCASLINIKTHVNINSPNLYVSKSYYMDSVKIEFFLLVN